MQAHQLPPLTELEQARLETCAARRQMIAANQTALMLMTRANDEAEAAIVAAATARAEAAAKAAAETPPADLPAAPTGDAEIVQLRGAGPVPAGQSAA